MSPDELVASRSANFNVSPPSSAPSSGTALVSSPIPPPSPVPRPLRTQSALEIRAEARGKTVTLPHVKRVLVTLTENPRTEQALSSSPAKKQVRRSEP
ncbi:hypothetical protein LTR35_013737 [Friedmanniomyces endolithicus]|nr:hypothetical protein LTR35_013737 [Friedmanniomyces endolithicus]